MGTHNLTRELANAITRAEYEGADLATIAEALPVLDLTNADIFTPTEDYHPATKKFVLDSVGEGDAGHTHTNLSELEKLTDGDHDVVDSGNPHSVTATEVGLGNCDDTSDVGKPVSTLQQAALDLKSATTHTHDAVYAPIAHVSDTENPHTVTAAQVDAVAEDGTILAITKMTQAAYDLISPVSTTLYVIVG